MAGIIDKLKGYGRNGDDNLLHVSNAELRALQGLGSMTGANLTTNPHTGLPEAFNFGDWLLPIAGLAAIAMTGGAAAPALAGAGAGAGAAAGATAAAGLGAGAGLGFGAELGAGAAGLGSAAIPAATGALAAPVASAVATPAVEMLSATAPTAVVAGPTVGSAIAPAAETGALNGAGGAMGQAGDYLGTAASGPTVGATPITETGALNGAGGAMGQAGDYGLGTTQMSPASSLMDKLSAMPLQDQLRYGSLGLAGLSSLGGNSGGGGGSGSGQSQKQKDNAAKEKFLSRDYIPMDTSATTRPNAPRMFTDPKYNFAQGGITDVSTMQSPDDLKKIRTLRSRYRSKKALIEDISNPNGVAMQVGITDPNDPLIMAAFGYTAKQGRGVQEAPDGSDPAYARGGNVGDGMSDSIPASIEGRQPARLSRSEFVVPSDVVSHLGNGSSEAGAAQLHAMMDRIRTQRTGNTEQAPQINPRRVLPA